MMLHDLYGHALWMSTANVSDSRPRLHHLPAERSQIIAEGNMRSSPLEAASHSTTSPLDCGAKFDSRADGRSCEARRSSKQAGFLVELKHENLEEPRAVPPLSSRSEATNVRPLAALAASNRTQAEVSHAL